jgi:hypothetical protein
MSLQLSELSEAVSNEIEARAEQFVQDNLINPDQRDRLMVRNAMLIGASIALEKHVETML